MLFCFMIIFLPIVAVCYKSGFSEFMQNEEAMKLVKMYHDRELKTMAELHSHLISANIEVTERSLRRYLALIKAADDDAGSNLDYQKCLTKFDDMRLFLIGKDSDWRKFVVTNEARGNIYLTCYKCRQLAQEQEESPIAHAIIRDSGRLVITQPKHHEMCLPTTAEELKAEQIDRHQRMQITCSDNPKSLWAQGAKKAKEFDLMNDNDPEEESSVNMNYPDWRTVRRSYNRRRQQRLGLANVDDIFDLPETLMLTQIGAIKLELNRQVTENDMWMRYRNEEIGVLLFMTKTQIKIAEQCRIIVADATFELSPRHFTQIWTLHGLATFGERGTEWVPLAISIMKNRDERSYQTLAAEIRLAWGNAVSNNIERFHLDYEGPEINAMTTVFGKERIFGCIVHYTRALFKNVRSLCPLMARLYIAQKGVNGPIYKYIRRIMALPFLRGPELLRMWAIIKRSTDELEIDLRPEANKLFGYMDRNWISKRKTGSRLWDFNHLLRIRNTNPAVAWHSLIKKDPSTIRRGSLYNLIGYLQRIVAHNDDRIKKILYGKLNPRPREKIYVELDEKIETSLNEYEGKLSVGFNNDHEFADATGRALGRLSHLLIQLDEKGRTKKEAVIFERKRKLVVKDPPPVIVKEKAITVVHETDESTEQQSKASNVKTNVPSTKPEIIVEKVIPMSQMRHEQIFLYNPLNEDDQRDFAQSNEYDFLEGQSNRIYHEQFQFSSMQFGPGIVQPIIADGNCGFRALSFCLTGTENNHMRMRYDMMAFLENSVHIASEHEDDNWWRYYGDTWESALAHAERKRLPAINAGEIQKWMGSIDFVVAARLFVVNIAVCEPVYEDPRDANNYIIVGYRWRMYSPHTTIAARGEAEQDQTCRTLFILFSPKAGHFEVINKPELLN